MSLRLSNYLYNIDELNHIQLLSPLRLHQDATSTSNQPGYNYTRMQYWVFSLWSKLLFGALLTRILRLRLQLGFEEGIDGHVRWRSLLELDQLQDSAVDPIENDAAAHRDLLGWI